MQIDNKHQGIRMQDNGSNNNNNNNKGANEFEGVRECATARQGKPPRCVFGFAGGFGQLTQKERKRDRERGRAREKEREGERGRAKGQT
mmetsp:Transcript_37032/g.55211  ORF Transcript_37032/g.55211 Transcript_37032/m.55211 type:complete len:89 (-) Transcript_37032:17-283(-)